MNKQTLLENPIVASIFLVIVTIVNLLFPVHFVALLLIGVVYKFFTINLKNENYYLSALMILAFSIIELSQGLKLFTLSLLAFSIHIFISPRLKTFFAFDKFSSIFIIFIFYIGVFQLFNFMGDVNMKLFTILLLNYIFDIVLVLILM